MFFHRTLYKNFKISTNKRKETVMKNFILGKNGKSSMVEQIAKILIIFVGIWAILFMPASYVLPILLILGCLVMAIRAGYTWHRAAWGVVAFIVLSQTVSGVNLLLKVGIIVGSFYVARKYDNKDSQNFTE